MCFAYIGNQAAGGFSGFDKRLNVTRVTGSHLNDGDFVLGGETQQCFGDTYVIIEVTLGRHHVIFLGKDGTQQFLGCGLAVGAGDTDYGDVKLASMFPRQVFKGLQGVGCEHHLLVTMIVVIYLLVVDHG